MEYVFEWYFLFYFYFFIRLQSIFTMQIFLLINYLIPSTNTNKFYIFIALQL